MRRGWPRSTAPAPPQRRRVGEAQAGFSRLARRACSSGPRRRSTRFAPGIDAQAAAVAALVEQASAGIGKTGAEAAESLAANVDHAEQLARRPVRPRRRAGARVAAHDRRDRPRPCADRPALHRARRPWRRARQPFPRIADSRPRPSSTRSPPQASSQDNAIGSLAERTAALRESIDRLAAEIRDGVGTAHRRSQGGADRLAEATAAMPSRRSAGSATRRSRPSDRMAATGAQIAEQQDRFAALLAAVDDGVGSAQSKLTALASAIAAGRARSHQPQRRNRPGAGRRTGAGQGSRRPRRRARARSDREQSSRKAPASCPKETRDGARAGHPRKHRGAAARGRRRRRARGRCPLAPRPIG